MSADLRPVPETPPRVLGLVRVSKERDGMVTPEIQRTAITDYCRARGYDLVDWLEGIDESGSRSRSAWWPRLDQAVAAVETGDYDAIVVWKFSRTARHRLRWAVAIDRVEQAGGRLESATEQVDVTTSTGRFTRGMLAELSAFEAERIAEGWREAHQRRVRAGLPPTGKPKWGYIYDGEEKIHRPDPETGPVLATLYRRYVAGESVYQLVRWLNSHGWRTLEQNLWSDRTLRRVLDSGFASGRFLYRGELHDGIHEPLIDNDLWQAYLDARQERRAQPARRTRSQYLLSGLVRCARCGGTMTAGQFGAGRAPKYRCKTSKEQGPEACAGGYVTASYVERAVFEELEELARDIDREADRAAAAEGRRASLRSEAGRLARELGKVDGALQRLMLQRVQSPEVPGSVFDAAEADLLEQRRGLAEAHEVAAREVRRAVADPVAVAASLVEQWHRLPVEHRRMSLRDLFLEVRVTTGRPRAVVEVIPVV
ncbi:recombinase family protein [Nocardioides massiliensis]|uniref:DNA invertase Pin-like site-specific DNA recombinase n=1 Tax=Nocardioides massiliensis TaxID=1325935 RepID=A0ABT9NJ40_9ACTN|nr:recombinase family protein [Nocardioides massiliensis]MDP9820433.1 DNA invertase Pin-like site-specific DNA recombinase [Nocardioides massiliensis]